MPQVATSELWNLADWRLLIIGGLGLFREMLTLKRLRSKYQESNSDNLRKNEWACY